MAKKDVVTSEITAEAPDNQEPAMVSAEEVNKLVQDAVAKALAEADSTKKSLEDAAAPNLIDAQKQKAEVYKEYMEEEMVDIYLSPAYRGRFGNVMPVTINGITILFPVDGSLQRVPATFADEINNRRVLADQLDYKTDIMSNVSGNVESTPGELELV